MRNWSAEGNRFCTPQASGAHQGSVEEAGPSNQGSLVYQEFVEFPALVAEVEAEVEVAEVVQRLRSQALWA